MGQSSPVIVDQMAVIIHAHAARDPTNVWNLCLVKEGEHRGNGLVTWYF